jgi:hypothetical protein
MRYVVAGYVIVLTLLFLYGAQLVWRQRRLTRAAERVEMVASIGDGAGGPGAGAGTEPVQG